MSHNATSIKFSLGFPDMDEWKIYYFNKLISGQSITVTSPKSKGFMGLYFNVGSAHQYKIRDFDQKTICSGEYNFIFVPEHSTQLTIPTGMYSVLCIAFTPAIVKKFKEVCPMVEGMLKCRVAGVPAILSPINMIITSELQESIQEIVLNKQHFQGSMKKIVDHSKVINLLFSSLDNILVFSKANLKRKEVEKVVMTRDYILRHLRSNFTVEQLAEVVGMEKRRLEKAFNAVYRKGVHRFYLDEKLKHASVLLRDTNLAVNEIGRNVGFNLASRFSEAFKKRYSFSPTEFRRLHSQ